MGKDKRKSRHLTIYLIKEGVKIPDKVLDSKDRLEEFNVPLPGVQFSKLYVQPSSRHLPGWAFLFENVLDINQLRSFTESSAAVLLITRQGKTFAVTFGQGRHLLEPGCWEERFGLRASLNSIGKDRLRSIDKRTFDAISRHSKEQASREVEARNFGLDIEQDLLRAATGTPSEESLGSRMTGIDALTVAVKADLGDVPNLLQRYLRKSREKSYKKLFPWVDQIGELTDKGMRARLDERLVEAIKAENFERLWLAVPDIIDWARVGGFRYTPAGEMHDDIHISSFLESLRDEDSLRLETLKHRRVYCYDPDGNNVTDRWPVYHCIYYETDLDGATYLLNGGNWYSIARTFIQQINNAIKEIPAARLELPAFSEVSEGAYNEKVAKAHRDIALMDKKNIPFGGGHSQIEFCDLFTKSKKIVHVKRYGGSSVLSHLFSQGVISGELFHTDGEFRKLVNQMLPKTHKLPRQGETIRPGDFEIVFGIVSRSSGNLLLPFFSRVNLRHAYRRLSGYGYKVSVAKIPVEAVA